MDYFIQQVIHDKVNEMIKIASTYKGMVIGRYVYDYLLPKLKNEKLQYNTDIVDFYIEKNEDRKSFIQSINAMDNVKLSSSAQMIKIVNHLEYETFECCYHAHTFTIRIFSKLPKITNVNSVGCYYQNGQMCIYTTMYTYVSSSQLLQTIKTDVSAAANNINIVDITDVFDSKATLNHEFIKNMTDNDIPIIIDFINNEFLNRKWVLQYGDLVLPTLLDDSWYNNYLRPKVYETLTDVEKILTFIRKTIDKNDKNDENVKTDTPTSIIRQMVDICILGASTPKMKVDFAGKVYDVYFFSSGLLKFVTEKVPYSGNDHMLMGIVLGDQCVISLGGEVFKATLKMVERDKLDLIKHIGYQVEMKDIKVFYEYLLPSTIETYFSNRFHDYYPKNLNNSDIMLKFKHTSLTMDYNVLSAYSNIDVKLGKSDQLGKSDKMGKSDKVGKSDKLGENTQVGLSTPIQRTVCIDFDISNEVLTILKDCLNMGCFARDRMKFTYKQWIEFYTVTDYLGIELVKTDGRIESKDNGMLACKIGLGFNKAEIKKDEVKNVIGDGGKVGFGFGPKAGFTYDEYGDEVEEKFDTDLASGKKVTKKVGFVFGK